MRKYRARRVAAGVTPPLPGREQHNMSSVALHERSPPGMSVMAATLPGPVPFVTPAGCDPFDIFGKQENETARLNAAKTIDPALVTSLATHAPRERVRATGGCQFPPSCGAARIEANPTTELQTRGLRYNQPRGHGGAWEAPDRARARIG